GDPARAERAVPARARAAGAARDLPGEHELGHARQHRPARVLLSDRSDRARQRAADTGAAARRAARLPRTLDLARLVDFEVQLHRDEETARAGGESTLQARDARLGSEIADELGLDPRGARARLRAERALRARVAEAWLLRVRGQEPGEGERTA